MKRLLKPIESLKKIIFRSSNPKRLTLFTKVFLTKANLIAIFATAFVIPLTAVNSYGQEPAISIRTDRTEIQIADPFNATIEVIAPSDADVQFPPVSPRVGEFDVLSHEDQFSIPSNGNPQTKQWTRRLTLETLETGAVKIPVQEVYVRTKDGTGTRIATKPLSVQVLTELESASDPAKFNDIQGVVDVPEPKARSYDWIAWTAIGGFSLAALSALAFVTIRRKRWITPESWANKQLNSNSKIPLSQLEYILRTFIEKEFGIPATSLTTEQIQKELSSIGAQPETIQKLNEIFSKAAQAKFAGLKITESDLKQSRKSASDAVNELVKIPTEAN